MVALRGSNVDSPTRAHSDRTDVEFDDADWDLEESGIAEMPPQLEQEPGPELWRQELELAYTEIDRLRNTVRELKRERDRALRSALSVRRELTHELETAQLRAREARFQAEQAERARKVNQKKALAKLTRFEQRIKDLRERLTGFQTLLSALGQLPSAEMAESKN
jgi:hypothetical protein